MPRWQVFAHWPGDKRAANDSPGMASRLGEGRLAVDNTSGKAAMMMRWLPTQIGALLLNATWCFAIIGAASGVLMSFYIVPANVHSQSIAAESFLFLRSEVWMGWWVLALHYTSIVLTSCAAFFGCVIALVTANEGNEPRHRGSRFFALAVLGAWWTWTGYILPMDSYSTASLMTVGHAVDQAPLQWLLRPVLGIDALPQWIGSYTMTIHGIVLPLTVVFLARVARAQAGLVWVWPLATAICVGAAAFQLVPIPPEVASVSHPMWMFMWLHNCVDIFGAELVGYALAVLTVACFWVFTSNYQRIGVVVALLLLTMVSFGFW
jgi:hypothetical protein